jgi:hypothetical protein
MDIREQFEQVLAEFGDKMNCRLKLEDGRCSFTVDGAVEIEIDYYDEAEAVVAWSTVGELPEDALSRDRALALLAINELGSGHAGFTLSMDPETRRVVAHDRRGAEAVDSADRLAVWMDALVDIVKGVRLEFSERFPFEGDDPDDEGEEG